MYECNRKSCEQSWLGGFLPAYGFGNYRNSAGNGGSSLCKDNQSNWIKFFPHSLWCRKYIGSGWAEKAMQLVPAACMCRTKTDLTPFAIGSHLPLADWIRQVMSSQTFQHSELCHAMPHLNAIDPGPSLLWIHSSQMQWLVAKGVA